MKGELGGKIIREFVALRVKTYSNIMDDGNTDITLRNKEMRNKNNTSV